MSFIDNWRVMVKNFPCYVCEGEIVEKNTREEPKHWRDSNKSVKREFWEIHLDLLEEKKKQANHICFVFRADCGGDSISLCKKHLQEIIKKIEEKENE